ncbi:PSP1 C-terminal conserved region-domain-containing protein [Pilaira anomala]|nr:PSP1 C-terminal conserved region-domain-containing protein [Pilaira anomala]
MTHFLENNSPTDPPTNDEADIIRRSSIVSESNGNANWGSFGGFQWEGPSIFDEEGKSVGPTTQLNQAGTGTAPDDLYDNSIRSVPMLPGVSLEPIYRQQRSLSFSMGQEPTFFGYDDYEDQTPINNNNNQYKQPTFNSSLAPMVEEEDGFIDDFDLAHIRSRSKSSGAAFGLLSQNQHSRLMNNGHIRRGSEQQDDLMINQRRRSSSRFFHLPDQSTAASNQMSLGDKERLDIIQRRLSQQQEYSFPDTTNNSSNNYNLMRRQSLTLATQPPSNIQQLADQLENTHLRSELGNFQQQQQSPQTPQQHPQQQQQQQPYMYQGTDEQFDTDSRGYQDLGKGIPVHRLDPQVPLYMVEFKGGRTDFFYVLDSNQFHPHVGDLVIVEADRGKDLGKIAANTLTIEQVTALEQQKQFQLQQIENKNNGTTEETTSTTGGEEKAVREIHIKRIFRLATTEEISLMNVKGQDEQKSLVVCQQKTKQRKLPMEVVDAEYQWDRRKLTFYFQAENRIDFRELVRELFKIYKTRIWMCVVTPPITIDDIKPKN